MSIYDRRSRWIWLIVVRVGAIIPTQESTAQCNPPGPCCPPPPASLILTSPAGAGYEPFTVLPVTWTGENINGVNYFVSSNGGPWSAMSSPYQVSVPCPGQTISVWVSATATCNV